MPIPISIPARDLILYFCVARGTTILAEFNSIDADLGAFAATCLEISPPFHSIFSHTARTRTYIFLTDTPFLYFAIFRDKFGKSQGLAFLNSLKASFNLIFPFNNLDDTLQPYCFQSRLNPVFHQLLQQSTGIHQQLDSPIRKSIELSPSREDRFMRLKKNKKDKDLASDVKASNTENCDDGVEIDDELKKESPLPNHKNGLVVNDGGGQHKAKKVWKKHVWVVLSLDLIVCSILFVTWLCICGGFKCVDN